MDTIQMVAFSKWRKLLVEETVVGTVKTTYVGIARFRRELDSDIYAYVIATDTAKPIRNIAKMTEDTTVPGTKLTEQFAPIWIIPALGNSTAVWGTDKFDQIRDDRASLTYL